MLVHVCYDGDSIGAHVGKARQHDDVEEVRRVSQRIDQGNLIWKSWAERVGGSVTECGGDEGAVQVPATALGELEAIREQYAGKVGASVSVGVGLKLSEAAKALLAAKLRGKDQIVWYTDEVGEEVEQAGLGALDEAAKLRAEYGDTRKAEPPGAHERMGRYRHHAEPVDPSLKTKSLGARDGYQVYLVDGNRIRHELDADFTMGGNPGRYRYVPEGEVWVDQNTNPDEVQEVVGHEIDECRRMESGGETYDAAHDDANRDQFAKAQPAMNQGPGAGFAGASRPSAPSVQAPAGPQGEHSEAQDVYDLLAEDRPKPPEATHAASDFERQLHEEAWRGEEQDMQAAHGAQARALDVKRRVAAALQAMQVQAPVLEQVRGVAPDAYAAMIQLAQGVTAMARELGAQQPAQQAKDEASAKPLGKSATTQDMEPLAKAPRLAPQPEIRELVHYSPKSGLKRLDPKRMGTSGVPSAEYRQGIPEVGRTYYYRAGTTPEPLVLQGAKAKYRAVLDPKKHRLYDVGMDPEGLRPRARELFLAGEGLDSPEDTLLHDVKRKGYHGFYNSQSALPHVVALFHAHPVEELPLHGESGSKRRMAKDEGPDRFSQIEVDEGNPNAQPEASQEPEGVRRVHNRFVGTKATEKTSGLGTTRRPMAERQAFDYSHHLTPAQRAAGYAITVYHHPDWTWHSAPLLASPQAPLMELSRNGKVVAARSGSPTGPNTNFLVPDEELPGDPELDARGLKYNRRAAMVRALGDAAFEHVQNAKRSIKQSIAGGAIGDVPFLDTLSLPEQGSRASLLEVDKPRRGKKAAVASHEPGALTAGLGQQLDVSEGTTPLAVPPVEAREHIVQDSVTSHNMGVQHFWDYSHLLSPEDRASGMKMEVRHTPGMYDNFMHLNLVHGNGVPAVSGWAYPRSEPRVNGLAPGLQGLGVGRANAHIAAARQALLHHQELHRRGQLEQALAAKQPSRFSQLELAERRVTKAETQYCTACKDPLDEDGHCQVKAHWPALDAKKAELKTEVEPQDAPPAPEDLDKAKLPMPGASAHHRVVLPPGSQISQAPSGASGTALSANKIKVQHSDGSTSVKQVEAGQIRSQDPSGHPVSSREPNSR